jgi:multidrug transporter EmrE-like cation transporter
VQSRFSVVGFLVTISLINAASQILMRWGGAQSLHSHSANAGTWQWLWNSRWWLLGIMVGWVAGLGWAWCVRRVPLGVGVPLYAGLVYILSVLSGVCFLKERISSVQAVGIITILIGLILVTLSPHPTTEGAADGRWSLVRRSGR